jgi:hypothetical protein
VRDYGCTSNAFTVSAIPLINANLAPKEDPAKLVAMLETPTAGPVGKCWVGALSGTRVTAVLGTSVSIAGARGPMRAFTTRKTRIVGARVTVVAICVGQALGLFADAALTDSGTAAVRLAGSAFRGVSVDAALVEIPV